MIPPLPTAAARLVSFHVVQTTRSHRATLCSLALIAAPLGAQEWRLGSPAGANGAALAWDSARAVTVLFGGRCARGPFADTWEHDGSVWRQATTTHFPGPRALHAIAYDSSRGRVVLFGGMTVPSRQMLAETWEYDGSDWTQVSTVVTPPGRTGHALAFDAAHNLVVLFAGSGQTFNTCYGDTWTYDGVSWVPRIVTIQPPARHEHAMAYDSARGRVVVFGGVGCSGPTLGDTWEWDGTAWTQSTAPGPSPRYGQVM